MTNFFMLILCMLPQMGNGQEGLQNFNISGIECRHISAHVTPQMVEKQLAKYIDTCVQWEGRVASIAEADPNVPELKTWVIPIEGKFAYCGSTLLKIDLTGPGMNAGYLKDAPLGRCDYLYSHGFLDIRRGDIVSFTGRILGISRKPDPAHSGAFLERGLIGVTEIHRIGAEKRLSLENELTDPTR
jgi:hypothetical protein